MYLILLFVSFLFVLRVIVSFCYSCCRAYNTYREKSIGFATTSCRTKNCCFSGVHLVYDHTNCSFTVRCYHSVNPPRSRLRFPCNDLIRVHSRGLCEDFYFSGLVWDHGTIASFCGLWRISKHIKSRQVLHLQLNLLVEVFTREMNASMVSLAESNVFLGIYRLCCVKNLQLVLPVE